MPRYSDELIDEIRNISNENKKPPMILKLNDDVNYLETDRNNLYIFNIKIFFNIYLSFINFSFSICKIKFIML